MSAERLEKLLADVLAIRQRLDSQANEIRDELVELYAEDLAAERWREQQARRDRDWAKARRMLIEMAQGVMARAIEMMEEESQPSEPQAQGACQVGSSPFSARAQCQPRRQ